MNQEIETLLHVLGREVPSDLAQVIGRLRHSVWPEMVTHWSRLTPTGFPIELTVTDADPVLRWTAEIAGPEIDEAHRLSLVAGFLASVGQPIPQPQLTELLRIQQGHDLRYGAWIGGRSQQDAEPRFKLFSEIPHSVSFDTLPLSPELQGVIARLPRGTVPCMIGVEPARSRSELYLRLPTLDPENLRPLLNATGYTHGLEALACSLPDGLRRLLGRRLGLSLASGVERRVQMSLFVSARTLFPSAPEMLNGLIPTIARIPRPGARLTLVSINLDPAGENVSFAVGVTSAADAKRVRPVTTSHPLVTP